MAYRALSDMTATRRFTIACARLTRLERRAITRCCNGDGPADKADDNALYRAKNKLRDQLALT